MKKKLAMMCLAGTMVLSLSACSSKAVDTDVQTEQTQSEETQTTTQEESTQETTEEVASAEEKVSDRADYVALGDLAIDEYVTLPDYSDMTVNVDDIEVTDDNIRSYIERSLLSTIAVTDRAVEDGDVVIIDFEGKRDGVAFDGGSAEDYQLTIGSNYLIEGFEEGLIGVKPGETVDLDLTFPTDYGNAELAGVPVVFTVTVKNIQESTDYDSVTEDQMKEMGLEYASKQEMWQDAETAVKADAQTSYESNVNNAIITYFMDNSTFTSVPEYLVEEEVQNYNAYMETICMGYYGVDLETFITGYYQMTMEDYTAELMEMSEDTVKQYMIIEAVARQEGIEVSQEEVSAKAQEEADEYGYESAEQLLDSVGETTYRMYMLQEQVMSKLNEMVTVEPATAAAE